MLERTSHEPTRIRSTNVDGMGPTLLCKLALRYLHARFHLLVVGPALIAVFYAMFSALSRAAPGTVWLTPALAGVVAFTLQFLQMRLADDLDDVEMDIPAPSSAAECSKFRCRLQVGFLASFLLGAALCAPWPVLLVGHCVVTLAVLLPFAVKQLGCVHRGVLAIAFEATPAALFTFVYVAWYVCTGRALPTLSVSAVIAPFWCAFEFWKLTRKIGDAPRMQPYFLQPAGLRTAATALLVVALVGHTVLISDIADWSVGFCTYLMLLPTIFAALLTWSWPDSWDGTHRWDGSRVRLAWRGLAYPALLAAGFIVESLRIAV